ncbi:MAG: hypothetical protein JW874_14730 [Spirochaetales bacterium]|nr:hypothetical protein [Spirochaetales bacterium]
MTEERKIEIVFRTDELPFYDKLESVCREKQISIEAYLKELIKTDLAWGHLARRKR